MSSSRQLVSSQICSEDEQTFSRKIVCKAHQDRHDTIIMSNKMAFPTPALLMTSLTDVIAIWWRRWKPPPFIMIIYANMKNLKPPPFPLLPPWEPLFHEVLVQVEQDKDHFVPWVILTTQQQQQQLQQKQQSIKNNNLFVQHRSKLWSRRRGQTKNFSEDVAVLPIVDSKSYNPVPTDLLGRKNWWHFLSILEEVMDMLKSGILA